MVSDKEYKMYINGKWVNNGNTFEDYNPATGAVWANIPDGDKKVAINAIDAAVSAQAKWATMPHTERAGILLKVADILEKRNADFVSVLVDESGSWIGKAMFEAGYVPNIFRAAAASVYQMTGEILPSNHGKVNMLVRKPLGVVSVISPWNFPLLLSARGLSFALAVGNTVVLKPSEETPVSGGLLIAELFEEAGAPDGVFNVVTCSLKNVEKVGSELISNPHIKGISFTGSSEIGRQVASKAGYLLKKATLELGGKNSLIILKDADMELALNAVNFGVFLHQGQICMSVEKIIIDEAIADEFTKRFIEKIKTFKVGEPSGKSNVIGPIINKKQLNKINELITEAVQKGAKLLIGGKYESAFYNPTILTDIKPNMRIYYEETFGPVASIFMVKNIDEAVAIANDSKYGLSAGIITGDEKKGMEIAERLQTGMVHINDSSVYDEPHIPFGGIKNSGRASVEAFTELQWLTLERGGQHYPPPFIIAH
ncbi:MAG: aldehyde dehydrogenase family protein [Deltaproteobacteria bacterium]|nr:aldehyde dehydrogenase family protein [Deltaproteobacteria bacterium]